MDFFGFCLVSESSLKSGCDEDAAELGGYVGGGRLCLRRVPGGEAAAGGSVRGVLLRGDGGEVVPGFLLVADQDDGDLPRARGVVPQAGERARGDGLGLPVAGDGDLGELRIPGDCSQEGSLSPFLRGLPRFPVRAGGSP
jgi:hypothetical protein